MKSINKNLIFILTFFACIFFIFLFNYFMLNHSVDDNSSYEILYDEDKDSVFTKLKMSKNYKFDKFILGSSTEAGLLNFSSPQVAKIIVYGMTYKDFYENMVVFLKVHKETKLMYLPIDIHALMNNNKVIQLDVSKEKFDSFFTMHDFINLYLNIDVTKENLQIVSEWAKSAFSRKKQMVDSTNSPVSMENYWVNYPKKRLFMNANMNDETIQKNLYYFDKIINYCQKKNVKIICFISPYNYIYLNDVFVPKKLEFLYKTEKLIVSKGIDIYDFSIANEYNFERMDKTFLFNDLMHPNFIYGEMVQKVLNKKEDGDKKIYRLINADNIDECFEKYKIGLENYRNTHKNYINQFKTYNYEPDSEDANFERKIEMKEILKKYNIYN